VAVYRPSYKDPKTGQRKRSNVWWYQFVFAGRRIQESSKSTRKTVAVLAERNRRQELERAFNNVDDTRKERVKTVDQMAAAYLEDYRLRNPRSIVFADYAIGHVTRLVGTTMAVDISAATIRNYQTARLKEGAAPKSINDEVGFFLRIMGERGDSIRGRLRRDKSLKLRVGRQIAKAYSPEEKAAMLEEAKKLRSPAIYPALVLALNCGVRDAELRGLQWSRIDLDQRVLTVGDSKTPAGDGRTIPLNEDALRALIDHSRWYLGKFGQTRPEWYVFPFGKPRPTDPTRPMVTLKTAWSKVKAAAGVSGRWHDNRHTFITDLAESGDAADETIRDLAGHVSKQMLKHYSHIRMEAKRRAVEAIGRGEKKPETDQPARQFRHAPAKEIAKVAGSAEKEPSEVTEKIGSPSWTRFELWPLYHPVSDRSAIGRWICKRPLYN
jgi:integrase